MKNTNKSLNIIVAGGSGFWAECNHYPSLLSLKQEKMPIKVVAIIDVKDPKKESNRPNLTKIIQDDYPLWINPSGRTEQELQTELSKLHKRYRIDIIIVSTNPAHHFFYSYWAVKNKINVLCDKPLVVTKNASFDLNKARLIQSNYDKLRDHVRLAKKENPRYIFCSPLRRRALTPFVTIATELEKIYKRTGEGIRYMNVIINGGVHKYPNEFVKGGAHGYLDGVGALSHSSYHYIDVIGWYLSIAKGKIAKLTVDLPYVFRVKDYLKIDGYKKLRELIGGGNFNFNEDIKIPEQVLNCELDFTFHIKLFDKKDSPIGLISYTSNHTTFTPRLTKFIPEMVEYTNDKLGGRMSQIYYDIHQGPLQNWQLIKNDVVFFGNNIHIKGRLHPTLGKQVKEYSYEEAYDKGTLTPKDLCMSFIKYTAGLKVSKKHLRLLSTFENQNLTNKLFSLFYEKIAEEYEIRNNKLLKTKVNSTIELDGVL